MLVVLRYTLLQDLSGVLRLAGERTATYCAILDNSGELMYGIGDMDIHALISSQYVCSCSSSLRPALYQLS